MNLFTAIIIAIAIAPLSIFLYKFFYRIFWSIWSLILPIKLETITVIGENGEEILLSVPKKTAKKLNGRTDASK